MADNCDSSSGGRGSGVSEVGCRGGDGGGG